MTARPRRVVVGSSQLLKLEPPARADLAQLEAVAGALTQWLDSEPDLARCWAGPNGCRRRFRVPVGPMEVPGTIGVAAKAIQSPDPQLDDSPMVWMVEVDGFIRDVRKLPLEIQPRSKAIRHPALGSARPDWCQFDWPRP